MKKAIKAFLHKAGLLTIAQHVYFNARTASPSTLVRELRYRMNGTPDGVPLPPARLIFWVIACRWAPVFLDSGAQLVDDMHRILENNERSLASFDAILDFGCGCGRLIRHVHPHTSATLYGSDYNPELIRWCQEHLSFGQFTTNDLAPPLAFDDASFDFIYARSVFTHLPEALQQTWIQELWRVLQPGGLLYLTMHGRPLIGGLTAQQRQRFEAGDLVVTYSSVAGDNLCSTYASRAFVERRLAHGFTLLDFVEGRLQDHLRQDIYLLQKQ